MTEFDLTGFLVQVVLIIISVGTTATVSAFVWYLKVRGQCAKQAREATKAMLQKLSARSIRISKTLLIVCQRIDSQTEKAHEGMSEDLRSLAQEMLEDENHEL